MESNYGMSGEILVVYFVLVPISPAHIDIPVSGHNPIQAGGEISGPCIVRLSAWDLMPLQDKIGVLAPVYWPVYPAATDKILINIKISRIYKPLPPVPTLHLPPSS